MKTTFSAIVLAAAFVAAPATHAAKKSALPTEVQGVNLNSICSECGVVADVRVETSTKGKGSDQGAASAAAASASSAGNPPEKKAKTVTTWIMTVTFKGGTSQTYRQTRNPGLQPGDVVRIEAGRPTKYVK